MSNKKQIQFNISENSDKTIVTMVKESPLGKIEKNILLQDFLTFVADFNVDKTVTDSGYLVPNLVRKLVKGTSELCFYFFPSITVTPSCSRGNFSSSFLDLFVGKEKDSAAFKVISERAPSRGRRSDSDDFNRFAIQDLKLRNVMLVTLYNKQSKSLTYNVFNTLNTSNIFQETAGTITDQTLLFSTLMPNHYSNSICWGSTGFEDVLKGYFEAGNYEGIKSIPYIYFNNLFNNDLASSTYSNMMQYNFSPALFNSVVGYYINNYNLDITPQRFKSEFESVMLRRNSSSFHSIHGSIEFLLLMVAPIYSDPALYSQYYSELKSQVESAGQSSDRSVISISQFINSRFSI